jgi:hypothetical protein
MTIQELCKNGNCKALIGNNRMYCIGDTAYTFEGTGDNVDRAWFIGKPIMWIDGKWVPNTNRKPNRLWKDTKVTEVF